VTNKSKFGVKGEKSIHIKEWVFESRNNLVILWLSGLREVDLVFPYFLSHFIFLFNLFFYFLFLELRVRVKPTNTRRKAWKDNVIQHVQHILALRYIHGRLG